MTARRALTLPLLSLVALAAPVAAQASVVGLEGNGRLQVADHAGVDNEIKISYVAAEGRFLVEDAAGIAPAGPPCDSVQPTLVACDDPDRGVSLIDLSLAGGNDVLVIEAEEPRAVPRSIPTIAGGGTGHDTLLGGLGLDRLFGDQGRDTIAGGAGADLIVGGPGTDGLIGFGGDDRIRGGPGDDVLFGFNGSDKMFGGPGRNTLIGKAGADRLIGGARRDVLIGGEGRDRMIAGDGPDVIRARDGWRDLRIDCGPGSNERVFVDRVDPTPKRC